MSIDGGENPKDRLGIKKPPLHLVPPALAIWLSKVFGFSAIKYGPFNWRTKKVKKTVYIDAAMRHLLALQDGEDIDPESGLPHWAHVAANAAIMLDADALGMTVDDREWKAGPTAGLLKQLDESKPKTAAPQFEFSADCKRSWRRNKHGILVPVMRCHGDIAHYPTLWRATDCADCKKAVEWDQVRGFGLGSPLCDLEDDDD